MAFSDRFKQPGMPASLGLHAAVLVASVVTFSSPRPLPDPVEAVSVEVIDESQIREVTKGEQSAKQAAPTPRVDRVSPKIEQNAPGEAQKQVNVDATPKPQEATAKEERKEVAAVVVPPPPPLRPIIPPKPVEPPKPAAVAPAKPAPSKTEEEKEEEAEEAIRQANKKKLEQQKLEQQRAEEQKKRLEEQKRLADQKKRLEEQERKEAEAERQEELKEAAEAKKREEQKKLADAKAAADAKKAEDAKKAQEAAKKAADEKKKRDAEQQARNQAAADSARRALLASREAPSNSGNTGAAVSRTPAAGAPTATGAKLNPSDKSALIGIISEQIENKLYNAGASRPRVLPQLRLQVTNDGTVASVTLINSSGEPGFQALAEAGIRAARQASPLRIPNRFTPMYSDWRSIVVQINPPE